MAQSITALQAEPNLRPFRTCEIKRRLSSVYYETDWYDVTNLVYEWGTISFELDTIQPFQYRIGQANLTFRNDAKQFAGTQYIGSVFSGFVTRYKTICRITTGLEDDNGVQYPSTTSVFYGVFSDDIVDTEIGTKITVNDITQVLTEFNASNVAVSVVGVSMNSANIISTIRDYIPAGAVNALVSPFLSVGAWLLTNTGRLYTVATSTDLDGISGLDLINQLAIAENYNFFSDAAGNVVFKERTYSTTIDFTFKGPSEGGVNVISLDNYNEGVFKIFNKISCTLLTSTVISTQESYSFGDTSGISLYGQREYDFQSSFVDTATAGSICSSLLSYHSSLKNEVDITSIYITQLRLQSRVKLIYRGDPSGEGSAWNYFLWSKAQWSGYRGGLKINEDFGVIGISIDMDNWKTQFKLRQI